VNTRTTHSGRLRHGRDAAMSQAARFHGGRYPTLPFVEVREQNGELLFQTFMKFHVFMIKAGSSNVNLI
jgi:hypothetical protein